MIFLDHASERYDAMEIKLKSTKTIRAGGVINKWKIRRKQRPERECGMLTLAFLCLEWVSRNEGGEKDRWRKREEARERGIAREVERGTRALVFEL